MSKHEHQPSDADPSRLRPSLSAAALTEIDASLRQVGFTFDDELVFADHEHAALRLLHLDPRERPYDASKKNVALRLAMIFEAAHEVASENPGIGSQSPEFWDLVKTVGLNDDLTFKNADPSLLAAGPIIIAKYHSAWNEFGRQDPKVAEVLLSKPLMDTPEANLVHRLYMAVAD
ncbi:hypothetical protein CGCVW01_v009867 [Colletotrichum viniferum]|nr:hypothetical protein CGCVW01_v009867 [Colletotrichum viniferum]